MVSGTRESWSLAIVRAVSRMDRAFTRVVLAVKAAELLGFLTTPDDRIVLTALGRKFLAAPRAERREPTFAELVGTSRG